MKYYIIAGEASGDLHGSNLMKALLEEDKSADIRFWGGDLMQNVGGTLVSHYKERAFMGFFEVVKNLVKVLKFIKLCKEDIFKFKPDVVIFIDNSGFNLRIAKWAKQQGFRTNYYISPQVWASRAGRVKDIKRDIDHMFVILPFEEAFYQKFDYQVTFVGHPLIDAIANRTQVSLQQFREENHLSTLPIIAILPGSRKQEITKMLSVMLSIIDDYKDYQFVIAGAPSQEIEFYNQIIGNKKVVFINNKTYDLLSVSYAALVASGTATLETALFKVPQLVCYKGGNISYQIAKRIITLKYISLVNLIMDQEVVKELIQNDFNKKNLQKELSKILAKNQREKLFLQYYDLEKKLGGKGASKKVAQMIVSELKK
ncbi:MAG: lipid-A-disaccharide synthase [Flavobacteriia bacterium]|nr:lipid-A-disaccharide synthase [Flavobacteriia bacterium]OIP48558.1 MAG: lipid-A-disaccharide synthase [Flavobacteriaceae bacterium CG2_30_31_66]PIV97072.1 MAG: lipid-A-disaccharide synthase [Flavobacteriaceae bacterium CG17_big_fil_post_rev_8_21_14_2_50_31_13]PIX13857.1 MAG: lipid-A-disaccharide synthase [Flavobacteriaceae bacterium CG_4_8_14_3_um_filter_31_8]PIY13697.1 MAG: lipid-A-disaccharide synthase [Flavobacteriaceae bacterium CG_4_10_14_3_um_filter_31_253]PIZ10809.1 MAG: lipid-A-disa